MVMMARRAPIVNPRDDLHRKRIAVREALLMPIGICTWPNAGGVEFRDLFVGQAPTDGANILLELAFIACADDHRGHSRALEQPGAGSLRDGFARLARHHIESIDDTKQVYVVDLRPNIPD